MMCAEVDFVEVALVLRDGVGPDGQMPSYLSADQQQRLEQMIEHVEGCDHCRRILFATSDDLTRVERAARTYFQLEASSSAPTPTTAASRTAEPGKLRVSHTASTTRQGSISRLERDMTNPPRRAPAAQTWSAFVDLARRALYRLILGRELKLAIATGMALVLCAGVLIGDHISSSRESESGEGRTTALAARQGASRDGVDAQPAPLSARNSVNEGAPLVRGVGSGVDRAQVRTSDPRGVGLDDSVGTPPGKILPGPSQIAHSAPQHGSPSNIATPTPADIQVNAAPAAQIARALTAAAPIVPPAKSSKASTDAVVVQQRHQSTSTQAALAASTGLTLSCQELSSLPFALKHSGVDPRGDLRRKGGVLAAADISRVLDHLDPVDRARVYQRVLQGCGRYQGGIDGRLTKATQDAVRARVREKTGKTPSRVVKANGEDVTRTAREHLQSDISQCLGDRIQITPCPPQGV